jgi:hypothetical protein
MSGQRTVVHDKINLFLLKIFLAIRLFHELGARKVAGVF